MKILFLANAGNIHTVRWVNALANRNHEVHLVFKYDDTPNENKINNKVVLHQLKYSGTKGYFMNIFELKKLFKKLKPDIVNAHYASGYGTLARMSNLGPLILSVWGSDVYDFPHESKIKHAILYRNLKYAHKIASTSNSMAAEVRKILRENLDIAITPFGVDAELFRKYTEDRKRDDSEIIIGNIKTLSPKYGIEFLIRAVKTLIDDLENNGQCEVARKLRLHIYGDGPQRNEYENLTNDLQIADITSFFGKIPNVKVPEALNNIDIFCCSSIRDSESFGVAVVEAMSCEVPVVVSNVDGFKEVAVDNITGYIVEKTDIQALANGIRKLVLDKNLRLRMGKAGRERVMRLYDWNKNVGTMEELYRMVHRECKMY